MDAEEVGCRGMDAEEVGCRWGPSPRVLRPEPVVEGLVLYG